MPDKNKTFARIVAAGDGNVYIILKNYHCCILSSDSLCSLLKNPTNFIRKECGEYTSKNGYPARMSGKLSDIPGLTLAYLTEERQLICEHPEVIFTAIQCAKNADAQSQINISEALADGKVLDEKQMCIKLFLSLGSKGGNSVENMDFMLSQDTQLQILSEILHNRFFYKPIDESFFDKKDTVKIEPNTAITSPETKNGETNSSAETDDSDLPFTLCNLPSPPQTKPPRLRDEKQARRNDGIPDHYICMNDFAKKHNVSTATIHKYKREGTVHPLKDDRGHLWFDPDIFPEKAPDGRGRKPGDSRKASYKPAKGSSYKEVQNYIQANGFFSDAIRPYIRTIEELNYYLNNKYREMNWYGSPVLTIPVDLEYYSETHKATNRELIIAGESPVVPKLEVKYDLHHIGQRKDSPLCIIPSNIHNGPKTYSIFHSGTAEEDIHSTAFALQRKQFWTIYVNMCDEFKYYSMIPYMDKNKKRR